MKAIFKSISRKLIAAFNFLSKILLAAAVPAIFGVLFTSLVLMNTALFGLANGALARLGLDTASSTLEKRVRAEAVQEERLVKRKAAGEIRDKAIRKATTSAKRNIAAMPLEAIPLLGVTTVVGVTAWEIKDLCEIMIHIDDLSSLYDAESSPDETLELCKSLREELDETGEKMRISREDAVRVYEASISKLTTSIEGIPPAFSEIYGESIKVMEGYLGSLGEFYQGEPAPTSSGEEVPKPVPSMAGQNDSSPIKGVYEESVKVMTNYFESAAKFYGWDQKE